MFMISTSPRETCEVLRLANLFSEFIYEILVVLPSCGRASVLFWQQCNKGQTPSRYPTSEPFRIRIKQICVIIMNEWNCVQFVWCKHRWLPIRIRPFVENSLNWGVLQIQHRSPQSRPVASRNQSQTHSDATGLNWHVKIVRTRSHTGSGHIPLRYLAR